MPFAGPSEGPAVGGRVRDTLGTSHGPFSTVRPARASRGTPTRASFVMVSRTLPRFGERVKRFAGRLTVCRHSDTIVVERFTCLGGFRDGSSSPLHSTAGH